MSGAGWSADSHAGGSAASFSSDASRRMPFVGREHLAGGSPVSGSLIGTGTISPAKNPLSVFVGRASVRLQRERVHLLARDAPLVGEHLRDPELDAERVVRCWRGTRRENGPTPPRAFDDIGARVIDSTPHAIAMSYAPAITPCATKCAACCDEPHCRSTLRRRHRPRQAGRDPRVAGDVAALLTGLRDAAADDVVDARRVDVVALDERRAARDRAGRSGATRRARPCACRTRCERSRRSRPLASRPPSAVACHNLTR